MANRESIAILLFFSPVVPPHLEEIFENGDWNHFAAAASPFGLTGECDADDLTRIRVEHWAATIAGVDGSVDLDGQLAGPVPLQAEVKELDVRNYTSRQGHALRSGARASRIADNDDGVVQLRDRVLKLDLWQALPERLILDGQERQVTRHGLAQDLAREISGLAVALQAERGLPSNDVMVGDDHAIADEKAGP